MLQMISFFETTTCRRYDRVYINDQGRENDIVRTIVDQLHPKRVLLFGSYTVGTAGPDSDIDLLIEMGSEVSPPERAMAVDALFGLCDWAMDVCVYTPAEIAQLREQVGSLVQVAEPQGRELDRAARGCRECHHRSGRLARESQ